MSAFNPADVPRGDPVALTQLLVRIDSQNPSLVPGAAGETAVAKALGAVLEAWGFDCRLDRVDGERCNLVARIGRPGGRSLMFNGHLDVVGVSGMTHPPFGGEKRDGRIYGRGSADMKSGIAAMCCAALRANEAGMNGEIIIAAVIDEEFSSLGTRALIASGVRADAAIVTEPTRLAIMPAHKGFVWADVSFTGRAAHGSRWELGVDAIAHAGLFLAELDRYDREVLSKRSHHLLGRPSVHASRVSGGTEMSTYPDRCDLSIERRTIPGETADQVTAELKSICERIRATRPEFNADLKITLAQSPSDVAESAPVVRQLGAALAKCNLPSSIEGMSAWTDAALLNEAGIPAICFGPGDISLAHAAEEFVPVQEIEDATHGLMQFALGNFS